MCLHCVIPNRRTCECWGRLVFLLVPADPTDSSTITKVRAGVRNGSLFPRELSARWIALRFQALADGLLDAAILLRYETILRPEHLCWADGVTAQMNKIDGALADIEVHAASFGERVDIGTISVACAVGYLDFRFKDKDWRAVCPTLAAWYEGFAKRPSMQATRPPDS